MTASLARALVRAASTRIASGSSGRWDGSRLSRTRAWAFWSALTRSAFLAAPAPGRCVLCQASCLTRSSGVMAANLAARFSAYLFWSRSFRLNFRSPCGVEGSAYCGTCQYRPLGVFPPCMSHRPFFSAGFSQGCPSLFLLAPQRGAALNRARFARQVSWAIRRNRAERRHGPKPVVAPRPRLANGPPHDIHAKEVSRKKRLEAEPRLSPFLYATGCFDQSRDGAAEKAACARVRY